MSPSPARIWLRVVRLLRREIWLPNYLQESSLKGWFYALLRIAATTWNVFTETSAATRAASLSFSSLLSLGPLVAIAIMVAGFILGGTKDTELIADKLHEVLLFVAPQIGTFEQLDSTAADGSTAVNSDLIGLIDGFIKGAQSGSAGVLGALSLFAIVLLLFKSIEDAFNHIWGVQSGRSLMVRLVYYWTILTLGAVLSFAALTLVGASALFTVFEKTLPFGAELVGLLRWSLPAISFLFLVGLLTLFYRVIPNTRVLWRAAFAGALVVTALLLLNNYVALFYARRVILTRSLYGSVGLPLVIMLGLYIFWIYVLIGGILSYAVQNVHFRSSQAAWSDLSEAMRERLSLLVLLAVCRRFYDSKPPISASELGTQIKVPSQILNASLGRLVELGLLSPLTPTSGKAAASDQLYQPAIPLERISLARFRSLFENQGAETSSGELIESLDPLVHEFQERCRSLIEQDQDLLSRPLDQLFERQAQAS